MKQPAVNWEKSRLIASQIDPRPNQCYFNAVKGSTLLGNNALYVEGYFVYLDVRKGQACAWEHGWIEEDGKICEFSPDCWPGECERSKYFPVRKIPKRHVTEGLLDIWQTYETGEGNLEIALSLIPHSRILRHAVRMLRDPDRNQAPLRAWMTLLQMQENRDPERRRQRKSLERRSAIYNEAMDNEKHRQALSDAKAYYKKLRGVRKLEESFEIGLPWP